MSKRGKIYDHVKKHQLAYAIGGTTIVVAGITIAIMKGSRAQCVAQRDWPKGATDLFIKEPHAVLRGGADGHDGVTVGSFFFKNKIGNGNSFVTTIHKGGRGNPGFITRCIETGEVFLTQEAAANAFGIPQSILGKHLNHGRDLIEDLHFERVGVLS